MTDRCLRGEGEVSGLGNSEITSEHYTQSRDGSYLPEISKPTPHRKIAFMCEDKQTKQAYYSFNKFFIAFSKHVIQSGPVMGPQIGEGCQ